jgi:hypothetical protein
MTTDTDSTETALKLNGKPVQPELVDRAIELFVEPMLDLFRLARDLETVDRAQARYGLHLARFDRETLTLALEWFEAHRKDPFMPTPAECIERCEAIYAKSDAGQLLQAFKALYPLQAHMSRPWPEHLGPKPGHEDCGVDRSVQASEWRHILAFHRDHLLRGARPAGCQPPSTSDEIGIALSKLLWIERYIDTTAADCPIPIEVRREFNLPTEPAASGKGDPNLRQNSNNS